MRLCSLYLRSAPYGQLIPKFFSDHFGGQYSGVCAVYVIVHPESHWAYFLITRDTHNSPVIMTCHGPRTPLSSLSTHCEGEDESGDSGFDFRYGPAKVP
jgi:hypothetical protein